MDSDTAVKLMIYETIAKTTQAPTAPDVAAAMRKPVADVQAAFHSLAQKRLLVLEPGDPTRIRMAPPFSGIETPHTAVVDGRPYFANCAWDALGVAAALHRDADIFSTCADCGDRLAYRVCDLAPVAQECAVHFAVPAARWWDDIIFT